jgi:hypothetical protein
MSNLCLVGGPTFRRRSTNAILLTTLTKKRFVSSSHLYNTDSFTCDRLIRASLGMMPWFVRLLDQHLAMQFQEPLSSFAHDIA